MDSFKTWQDLFFDQGPNLCWCEMELWISKGPQVLF